MEKRPSADLRIVPLDARHDGAGFSCGVESLDRYLETQAGQDVRRKANAVFVLSERGQPVRILQVMTRFARWRSLRATFRRRPEGTSRAIRW